ncbi:hypothetical protein T10_8416 [Trichinella papuae]|uniref:Uncharacterized protein n=1 Tax=Trichinella papuae TaxID=268474 RepID=A0A0V1M1L6_9BILA|nr:hypothetical protein T10_8416 [Trichinella papuae]
MLPLHSQITAAIQKFSLGRRFVSRFLVTPYAKGSPPSRRSTLLRLASYEDDGQYVRRHGYNRILAISHLTMTYILTC